MRRVRLGPPDEAARERAPHDNGVAPAYRYKRKCRRSHPARLRRTSSEHLPAGQPTIASRQKRQRTPAGPIRLPRRIQTKVGDDFPHVLNACRTDSTPSPHPDESRRRLSSRTQGGLRPRRLRAARFARRDCRASSTTPSGERRGNETPERTPFGRPALTRVAAVRPTRRAAATPLRRRDRGSEAEGVGFEPTVPGLPVQRFSRPPDSTTLAPLRGRLGRVAIRLTCGCGRTPAATRRIPRPGARRRRPGGG